MGQNTKWIISNLDFLKSEFSIISASKQKFWVFLSLRYIIRHLHTIFSHSYQTFVLVQEHLGNSNVENLNP